MHRRDFLSHCSLCAAGAWLLACDDDKRAASDVFDSGSPSDASETSDSAEDVVDARPPDATTPTCDEVLTDGTMIAVVAFDDEDVVFGRRSGAGWDGRRYTDLSVVPEVLKTPTDLFYLRTFFPDLLDTTQAWQVTVDGLVDEPHTLSLADLLAGPATPMGVHVLECSGNRRGAGFGLMSAASWAGVRVMDVVARLGVKASATRLLVEGFDEHSVPSVGGHSTPGASWVFSFEELEAAGAFFATEMNGHPLPPDHGEPLRLYVPGWYGCSCIKWVQRLVLVDEAEPATSQMREFASRTHQSGVPTLARDYQPAMMDQAAMPVRIEKWRDADDALVYRVLGVMWGGLSPTNALVFEDGSGLSETVDVCPPQTQNQLWTVWQHLWRPTSTGRYTLRMRIDDDTVRTRRLDLGFYERFVIADEV